MFPLYGSSGGGSGGPLYCKLSGDWNMVWKLFEKTKILKTQTFGNLWSWGTSDLGMMLTSWSWTSTVYSWGLLWWWANTASVSWVKEFTLFLYTSSNLESTSIFLWDWYNISYHINLWIPTWCGVNSSFSPFMITFEKILSSLCLIHLFLQLIYLLQFSLPTVLSSNLIFPPPSNVATNVELLLWEILFAQHIIELIHGRVHNIILMHKKAQSSSNLSKE